MFLVLSFSLYNHLYMKRVLTGDRPTGVLHLGHFVGSLRSRLEMQDTYEVFILIADVQALTDNFDNPSKIRNSILEIMKDYLSIGLDPSKCKFILQSEVPEIAELTIFFSNLVTISRLMRNPTVKSEIIDKKGSFTNKNITYGFLGYPVSQAADITIFEADVVPVGIDQSPMVEQTVELVKKFNLIYKNTLKIPKVILTDTPMLVGIDGKSKMSKSLGNTINLSEEENMLKKKVFSMYTDPTRIHKDDPGHVEGNPVFIYHRLFNDNIDEVRDLEDRYKKGTVGDVEVKEKLFIALNNFITPIREKRLLLKDENYLLDILSEGTKYSRAIARDTIVKVKDAMALYSI